MDPMDDNEDVLRQNRSREKQFMFDIAFDAKATQVSTQTSYNYTDRHNPSLVTHKTYANIHTEPLKGHEGEIFYVVRTTY